METKAGGIRTLTGPFASREEAAEEAMSILNTASPAPTSSFVKPAKEDYNGRKENLKEGKVHAKPADQVRVNGEGALEEVSAQDVQGTGKKRRTGRVPVSGAGTDESSNTESGGKRHSSGRGLGTSEGRVDITSDRGGPESLGRGKDYVITDEDVLAEGGEKTRFRNNVEAIKIAKQVAAESRPATLDEQKKLVKYLGWGGLSKAFAGYGEWQNEYQELHSLLTPKEWDAAKRSTQNAHYTSAPVIKAMYDVMPRLGFKGGRILEPAMGVGHFFGLMPQDMKANSLLTGVELDPITGLIAHALYPNTDIRIEGFQETKIPDGFYDAAISNVPFGDYPVFDQRYQKSGMTKRIHSRSSVMQQPKSHLEFARLLARSEFITSSRPPHPGKIVFDPVHDGCRRSLVKSAAAQPTFFHWIRDGGIFNYNCRSRRLHLRPARPQTPIGQRQLAP